MEFLVQHKRRKVPIAIDRKDWPLVRQHDWWLSSHGYAATKIDGRCVFLHRLLLGLKHGDGWHTDHRDGDTRNNRRSNIRVCSSQQNMRNKATHKNSTSGVTGVHFFKATGAWAAHITVDYKTIHLGYFQTKKEAVEARTTAEVKMFGEFAPSLSRGKA